MPELKYKTFEAVQAVAPVNEVYGAKTAFFCPACPWWGTSLDATAAQPVLQGAQPCAGCPKCGTPVKLLPLEDYVALVASCPEKVQFCIESFHGNQEE